MRTPQIIAVSRAQILAEVEAKIADAARKQPSTPVQSGVDLNDIGHDIITGGCASNIVGSGSGFNDFNDFSDPRVEQYPSLGLYANQIVRAVDPLFHNNTEDQTNKIGPMVAFAKHYISVVPSHRKALIVPVARNGTGFSSDAGWNVGEPLYNFAVTQINAAIALNPANRPMVFLYYPHGGDRNLTKAQFIQRLDAFILGMRASISKGQNLRFLLGGFTPQSLIDQPQRVPIHEAVLETPNRIPFTAAVAGTGLTSEPDGVHYSASAQRIMGKRFFDAYKLIK